MQGCVLSTCGRYRHFPSSSGSSPSGYQLSRDDERVWEQERDRKEANSIPRSVGDFQLG
jgi:hypothetical protein